MKIVSPLKRHSFVWVCRWGCSFDSMGRARFQFELVRPPRGRTRKGWRSGDVLEHPRVSGIRLRAFLLPSAPRELAFPAFLAARSSRSHTGYVHLIGSAKSYTRTKSNNLKSVGFRDTSLSSSTGPSSLATRGGASNALSAVLGQAKLLSPRSIVQANCTDALA